MPASRRGQASGLLQGEQRPQLSPYHTQLSSTFQCSSRFYFLEPLETFLCSWLEKRGGSLDSSTGLWVHSLVLRNTYLPRTLGFPSPGHPHQPVTQHTCLLQTSQLMGHFSCCVLSHVCRLTGRARNASLTNLWVEKSLETSH